VNLHCAWTWSSYPLGPDRLVAGEVFRSGQAAWPNLTWRPTTTLFLDPTVIVLPQGGRFSRDLLHVR